jgi:hypothetical protein
MRGNRGQHGSKQGKIALHLSAVSRIGRKAMHKGFSQNAKVTACQTGGAMLVSSADAARFTAPCASKLRG